MNSIIRNLLAIISSLSLCLYCAWSILFQTGLYATLVRLQYQHLEIYYPVITAVILLIACIILPMAIFRVSSKDRTAEQYLKRQLVTISVIGLVTIGLAGFAYVLSLNVDDTNSEPRKINLTQPPSDTLWFEKVIFDGISLTEYAVFIEEGGRRGRATKTTWYTPVVAEGDDKLTFVIASSVQLTEQNAIVSTENRVSLLPLPVLVKDDFKRAGFDVSGPVYLIGNDTLEPKKALWVVVGLLGIFGVFFLVAAIPSAVKYRRLTRQSDN